MKLKNYFKRRVMIFKHLMVEVMLYRANLVELGYLMLRRSEL